ncbi:MAG: thioredoxin family protein [Thermoguttaceae bacterium]|jgi:peroxiredoxin|nr:thioredoxin family protein [Thermoguttaceae bacterium]
MNTKWTISIGAVSLTLLVVAGSCMAALEIGQKAPSFSGLPGVDGKDHSLADYAEAKAVVVVFTCNHCPVAKAYEDRLIAFQKDYKAKGVQVIAINPNSPKKAPQDSFDKMKERAAGKDLGNWRDSEEPFNFPYVVDATQEVAKAYGATCTPHVFVLDGGRNIAYMGAIDDNMATGNVKQQSLRDALDAILAGKAPEKAATKQFGCSIKWD